MINSMTYLNGCTNKHILKSSNEGEKFCRKINEL